MIRIRRIQAPPLRTRRYEVEYRPADSSEAGWQLIGKRKKIRSPPGCPFVQATSRNEAQHPEHSV